MLKPLNGLRLVRFQPEYHTAKHYEWLYSGNYSEYNRRNPFCPDATEIALSAKSKSFMVVRCDNAEIVGVVWFPKEDEAARNFEIEILIDSNFSGNDFGATALKIALNWKFNFCNFYKAKIKVMAEDKRILNALDRFGFYREGGPTATFKNEVYFDGEYHDIAGYAMFKRDFNSRYKNDFLQEVRLESPLSFEQEEPRLESRITEINKNGTLRLPIREQRLSI